MLKLMQVLQLIVQKCGLANLSDFFNLLDKNGMLQAFFYKLNLSFMVSF